MATATSRALLVRLSYQQQRCRRLTRLSTTPPSFGSSCNASCFSSWSNLRFPLQQQLGSCISSSSLLSFLPPRFTRPFTTGSSSIRCVLAPGRSVSVLVQPQQQLRTWHPELLQSLRHQQLHRIQQQQRRSYWFLPTSWTELKLRLQSFQERTIPVRLRQQMKQQFQDTRQRFQVRAKERVQLARTRAVAYSREKVGRWVSQQRQNMTARRKAYRIQFQQRSLAFRQRLRARTWIFFQTKMQSLRTKTSGLFVSSTANIGSTSPLLRHRLLARSSRFRIKVMQSLMLANKSFQRRIMGYNNGGGNSSYTATSLHLGSDSTVAHGDNNNDVDHVHIITLKEYSEAEWFDDVGRPLTSQDATGRFVNPWQSQSSSGVHSLSRVLRWRYERFQREYAIYGWKVILPSFWKGIVKETLESMAAASSLPTLKPIQPAALHVAPGRNAHSVNGSGNDNLSSSSSSPSDIRCTWLGHATCLVQQDNLTILTDPMFSERASPYQNVPVGIARDVPPIYTIPELFPEDNCIDFCLISHDHYDHLDVGSVMQLKDKVAGLWIVPRGVGDFLQERCGIPRHSIVELEWWETARLEQRHQRHQQYYNINNNRNNESQQQQQRIQQPPQHIHNKNKKGVWKAVQFSSVGDFPEHPARAITSANNNAVYMTCCPAQHWAGRTILDRNFRLWCSFAVFFPRGGGTFYFAGDTALPAEFPLFEQISEHIGPVDFAALPIAAYQPDWFMKDSHVSPPEAVVVHQKLNCAKSLGIHWGTFPLSEEPMAEPPQWLQQEAKKAGIEKDFVTIPHGASITVPCRQEVQHQQQGMPPSLLSSSSYEWIVE